MNAAWARVKAWMGRAYWWMLTHDTSSTELVSGLILAWSWGITPLMPYETFANNPSFRAMADVAPEVVWGAVGLSLGILQIFYVLRDFTIYRHIAATFALGYYVFLATMYLIASPTGIAFSTYSVCAAANAWVVWRLVKLRSAGGA